MSPLTQGLNYRSACDCMSLQKQFHRNGLFAGHSRESSTPCLKTMQNCFRSVSINCENYWHKDGK